MGWRIPPTLGGDVQNTTIVLAGIVLALVVGVAIQDGYFSRLLTEAAGFETRCAAKCADVRGTWTVAYDKQMSPKSCICVGDPGEAGDGEP